MSATSLSPSPGDGGAGSTDGAGLLSAGSGCTRVSGMVTDPSLALSLRADICYVRIVLHFGCLFQPDRSSMRLEFLIRQRSGWFGAGRVGIGLGSAGEGSSGLGFIGGTSAGPGLDGTGFRPGSLSRGDLIDASLRIPRSQGADPLQPPTLRVPAPSAGTA